MRGDLNTTLMPGVPTVTPNNVHQHGGDFDNGDDQENLWRGGTGAGVRSLDDVKSYINSLKAEKNRKPLELIWHPKIQESPNLFRSLAHVDR